MRRIFAILSLGLLAGCGGSNEGTNPNTLEFGGAYTLVTMNGKPLPVTLTFSPGNSYTMISERITIIPGGSWLSAVQSSSATNGVSTPHAGGDLGEWTRTGTSVLLTGRQVTTRSGTASGSTMTLSDGANTYAYTR